MPLLYNIERSRKSCSLFAVRRRTARGRGTTTDVRRCLRGLEICYTLVTVTLTTRNTILAILLVLAIALSFLFILAGYVYRPQSMDDAEVQRRLTVEQRYLFYRWHQPAIDMPHVFVVLSTASAISILGTILVLRYFRRTNAPEVFLFGLFLVSLSGDIVKLAIPLLILFDQPPLYGAILTRVVQFCHLFGAFCLFASTLFATGMDYQRLGNVAVVAFVVALAMTYTMPVDSLALYPSLVYQMGDQLTIQLLIAALTVLSIVNVVNAAVVHGGEGLAVYAVTVLLMFAGRELVFVLAGRVASLLGAALLLGGAVTYGVKKYFEYLWA